VSSSGLYPKRNQKFIKVGLTLLSEKQVLM
jgi:hypothetical protein